MSEEKTEQPTPKKRRDAREKGQVAQSKDINLATAICTLLAYIIATDGYLSDSYKESYKLILNIIAKGNVSTFDIIATIQQLASFGLKLLIPIAIAAVASLFINIVQLKGIVLSKEFPKFKFDKFNPINNAKSIFSKKTFLKFAKQIIEIVVMLFVVWLVVKINIENFLKLSYATYISDIIYYITKLFTKILVITLSIYIIVAIVDYMIEAISLTKQLMMSHKEIEEEYKNSEGNPEIKGKRKELHRELLEEDSTHNIVSHASFIVANPTHIAILILYNPLKWLVPIVIAKATDEHAFKLIQVAKENDVFVIVDKPLARKMFSDCPAGTFITGEFIPEIAKIIMDNLDKMPIVAKQLQENKVQKLEKPEFKDKTTFKDKYNLKL
ncbi:MAG: EscU/YscU/HrcU family type III secretion system export apparatus switch protein [Burkholderiales bacterium]|nr:EscU/YscU/HrcU family type III secretion system export apparatus switch protein [Burkholderiales bacterium]